MRCAATAIAAMGQVSGGLRMTSLALELASQDIRDGAVEIRTTVDKRTRSILFVSVEAWAGDQLVFTAQGLFSPTGGAK